MRTIQMSDYTVGEDAFDAIPETLAAYGAKTVVLVGGRRALDAAAPGITAALAGTGVAVLDTVVYGTDSTRTNVNRLVAHPAFAEADVAFAIGGGKAIDTVKTAASELGKTVFSVPTICSNCSAATAIAVIYHDDGSLEGYAYPPCPAHIFINPQIIAEAPPSTSGRASATRSPSSRRSSGPRAPASSGTPHGSASRSRGPAPNRS